MKVAATLNLLKLDRNTAKLHKLVSYAEGTAFEDAQQALPEPTFDLPTAQFM